MKKIMIRTQIMIQSATMPQRNGHNRKVPIFKAPQAISVAVRRMARSPWQTNNCGAVAARNGEDAYATLAFDAPRDAERFDLDDQDEDEERFK
jgi:hypothetical protein